MAHSVLLIPVPEAEFAVRPRLALRSPDLVPITPEDTAAHITLLSPFAGETALDPGMLAELTDFFADVLPFHYSLASVTAAPDGSAYLTPDPAAPFRQLTHELAKRFPEYPPYGGEFDEVVPHLSMPLPEGEDVDRLRLALEPRLPISAYAGEAVLYWWEPDACRALETFPFGTAAA